jgi:hypothetical protein
MTEPGTGAQQPADDEQQDTGVTSDPARAGGGRTEGETTVDDDLGRGELSAG